MFSRAASGTLVRFYYYRARWYDPAAKRFITEDPIGLDGGINLYAYVGNNPINKIDPMGLDSIGLDHPLMQEMLNSFGALKLGPTISTPSPAPKYGKCLANVSEFVNVYLQDAQTLANRLGNGVSAAEVLAVAGNETNYGKGHAKFGNFFGLHGSGPAGTYYTTENQTPVAKFPVKNGFLLSGQRFVDNVRPYMQSGMGTDPLKFFTILNNHGYATGNSGYPAFMVSTGKKRGPYTLVLACME
jgi:RHS repeat-associated protein